MQTTAVNRWQKLKSKFDKAVEAQSKASGTLNYFWINRRAHTPDQGFRVPVPLTGPREMSREDICNVGLVIVPDIERYTIVEDEAVPKTHRDVQSFRSKRR